MVDPENTVIGAEPLTLEDTIADSNARTPEELLGTRQGRALVRRILRKHLSAYQLHVCELLYGVSDIDHPVEPLSESEVSRLLDKPVGAIKGVRQTSLRKLREVVGFKPLLQVLSRPYRAYGRAHVIDAPLNSDERPRSKRGNPKTTKLTPDQVREIRTLTAAGARNKDLAKQFNVAKSQISAVVHRKTWKDVV